MPLPSAQPTPRAALSTLIAALAVAGCSGMGAKLGGAYPAALHGPGQVSFGAAVPYLGALHAPALAHPHGPLRRWPSRGQHGDHSEALPHPVEDKPRDWIDQPEGRALTRQMQGLITAHERRQRICMAMAEPKGSGATDACGGTAAGGLQDRLLQAVRGDHQALRDLARHGNTLGGGGLAGYSGFASKPGGLASQGLWARVGGDLALYKLAAATYLLLPHAPDAPDGPQTVQDDADGPPAHEQPLMALRRARPSIAQGSWERAVALGATLSVQRRLGAELTVVTYNYGRSAVRLPLAGLPAGARLQALHPRTAAPLLADAAGWASVPLAAQSFAVWQVLGSGPR